MREYEKKQKVIPESKILKYIKEITKGLQYLHNNNVIHRNLNSENILIDKEDKARVTNFAISRILKNIHSRLYKTVQSYGYMSSEVLKGEVFDSSADIWSLGCILYQLCTFNVVLIN
jgi:NIMA (never in mitosis gene a)-related kinase